MSTFWWRLVFLSNENAAKSHCLHNQPSLSFFCVRRAVPIENAIARVLVERHRIALAACCDVERVASA